MSNALITQHRETLEKMRPEFAKALPAHITPDKLVRSVLNAMQENPDIALCEKGSILKSAMTAAVLGLEVDNAVGQGYIIPFKPYKGATPVAQFIPGYKGYITLAYNSGFMLAGETVREKDEFDYEYGLSYKLHHKPAPGTIIERGAIVAAYATARHAHNPPVFRVLDVVQIHQVRDGSGGYKAFKNGYIKTTPWEGASYPAMCAKTAIRALADQLPLNVQRAAALEQNLDLGKPSFLDGEFNVRSTTQQREGRSSHDQPTLVSDTDDNGRDEKD